MLAAEAVTCYADGMKPKSVLAILASHDACAWYRVVSPFHELKNQGLNCAYTSWDKFRPADLERYDVFVTPRLKPGDEALVKALAGRCVIYDIDDDFTRTPQLTPLMEQLWRSCKAITVPTRTLADVMRQYNARVYILPNCLDFKVWGQPVLQRDKRLTIGLTGGSNHYEDWQLVAPALRRICAEHPETVVALAGFHPDYLERSIPPAQLILLPWAPYARLPLVVGAFDIGLAPLCDTAFNRAKSPVKALEYMARGIPWVASAVGPYLTMPAENAGLLAATPDEFYTQLKCLVLDAGKRQALGEYGSQWVRAHHDICANAASWRQVYQAVWRASCLTA